MKVKQQYKDDFATIYEMIDQESSRTILEDLLSTEL